MGYRILEEEMNTIEFSVGDMIIESATGNVGFLVKRTRRIDMAYDDMYFWEVRWADDTMVFDIHTFAQFGILEEEHLKTSIILGIIKWQSVNGGTFEL
jgi:hypothetical protein